MKQILVIDDSQSVRTQLTDILADAGYDVIEAADGNEGLSKLCGATPDAVITDYNMPGLDGIAMLEQANEKMGRLSLPVFMLTTETSQQLKQQGKEAGIRAWITKPFNAEKLLKALTKVL